MFMDLYIGFISDNGLHLYIFADISDETEVINKYGKMLVLYEEQNLLIERMSFYFFNWNSRVYIANWFWDRNSITSFKKVKLETLFCRWNP